MTTAQEDPTYALGRSRAEYERLSLQAELLRGMTHRLFREAGIHRGMRVLDAGSGVGDVAFLAAELVGPEGSVVGVDIDDAALSMARARAKLLGLRNVTFVEGDVRGAAVEGEFDAAVGRLVLLYVSDPAEALRKIAERVRPGGAIAFLEYDMDPDVRACSFPGGTLWDETAKRIIETMARANTNVRMGRQLYGAFLAAGLPAPAVREETVVGCGADFGGYAWVADTARSLAPMMEQLGVATTDELEPDTLAERLRDDALERGAMVWGPPVIGAHSRRR